MVNTRHPSMQFHRDSASILPPYHVHLHHALVCTSRPWLVALSAVLLSLHHGLLKQRSTPHLSRLSARESSAFDFRELLCGWGQHGVGRGDIGGGLVVRRFWQFVFCRLRGFEWVCGIGGLARRGCIGGEVGQRLVLGLGGRRCGGGGGHLDGLACDRAGIYSTTIL